MNNGIIGFTETQINTLNTTCKSIDTLNSLKINFSNNENKFLNLTYWCRNDVAVLDKFDAERVSIFSFKKHAFTNKVFNLMLLFQKIIHVDARVFSDIELFTSSKFPGWYSKGLQLWSCKIGGKQNFR